MFFTPFFLFGGDLDVDTFGLTFALGVFFIAMVRVLVIKGPPFASVSDFGVWDIEAEVLRREFVGFPTAFLVVVFDNEPETVREVKFYRKERALVVHEVSCLISNFFKSCSFEEFLGDVAFSLTVEG